MGLIHEEATVRVPQPGTSCATRASGTLPVAANPPQPLPEGVGRAEPADDEEGFVCTNCNLFQLCLPIGMGEADLSLLDRIIKRRRTLRRGELLYRPGDPFLFIYAVKSGSFMTYVPIAEETDQVSGFHLPGELLGLDAIHTREHTCGVRALETASVCEVPLDRLEELGAIVTSVQRQLLRVLSRQIQHDQALQVLLCKKNAEQRLAAFLVNLSARFQQRGFSASEFRLPMSRAEIGSYLGLTKETISRVVTAFQNWGLITVERRNRVRLINLPRLAELAGVRAKNA
jgi:CRP/FNR family transcriptional regulator